MFVHSLSIHMHLPSTSLKGKRGIVKSILARVRQRFNVSAIEADLHDLPGETVLAFAVIHQTRAGGSNLLERVEEWIAEERPDVEIVASEIEER